MREKDASDNTAIRAVAFSYENLAEVFEKMNECEKATLFYQKSYEMFSLLEQKKALSDYDRKRIEKSQNSLPDCKPVQSE